MTIRRYITPIFALTLLSALSERILAQEIRPDFSVGTPLPEGLFNPTAPDVSAMMRYGGRIGTSFYTGAAHLSIPVFDYENADISLPISLEYDCNGYKPGVTASTLGYGWHLSVGGAITREIHGLPDEVRQREYGSRNTGDADAIKDIIHMAELSNLGPGTIRHLIQTYIKRQTVLIDGYASRYASDMTLGGTDFAYSGELGREYVLYRKYDGQTRMGVEEEPDTYHFQFPGHSGSFTLGDNGRVVILESSTPAGELNISMHYNRNEPGTSTFTITTGEGTQYHFEYRDNCHAAIYGSDDDGERSVSAWRLTRIVSRTGLTATITYSDYSQMLNGDSMARGVFMENLKLWDSDGETHTAGIYADDSPSSSVIVTNFVSYGAVQSIEIPGRLSVSFGYDGSYDASKLSSIRVRNVMGTLVRSCVLEYKVSGPTAVFLKKASLSGEGVYTFSYFDEDSNGFPSMELGKTDCFGYYTTAEDRPDKGTRSLRAYAESLESTRLGFDSGRTMMGMLRTVAYPTGGRVSEFNTTDSRGRIVMTQVGYLDEVPSYPTDITVTREGRVLSAARYAYDSFPTGSTQSDITILPVAVSRGVTDRNGTLTGYEEVLSVNGYDMYGNPLSVRDASGNVTEYSWGYGGLLMTGKSVNVGGGSVLMTSWAYSPLQGMTSMTAPDGTVTKYTLDKYGRLTAVMKSRFEISSYSYNVINFQ